MRLNSHAKIEKICAGSHRPLLADPYLEVDRKGKATIVATDGTMLACVPCEAEPKEEGYIPKAALAVSRYPFGRHTHSNIGIERKNIKHSFTTRGKTINWAPPEQNPSHHFPKGWRKIESISGTNASEPAIRIGLDAEKLAALSEAIGSKSQIVLEIRGPHDAVVVRPYYRYNEPNAVGYIMPLQNIPDYKPVAKGKGKPRVERRPTRRFNFEEL